VTPPSTPATKFKRALLLRCPRCGGGGILKSWLRTLIEIVAAVLCVALPFVFFPFSRTLWLAWDLSFRPAEPGDE
jgi:hypothetical protein